MKNNIVQTLFRGKWVISIILFLVFTIFVGENNAWVHFQQIRERYRLSHEVDSFKQKFIADSLALRKLKSDPEAIVKVARERYYMKTDDEDIFIVDDDELEDADDE